MERSQIHAVINIFFCSFHAHSDERAGKARLFVTLPLDRGPFTARVTRFLPHFRHSYVLCSLFTEGLHFCVQS